MASENGADTGGRPEVQQLWRLAPTTYKAGVVMATLGWFLSVNISSKSTRNGVITSCNYLDIGQSNPPFRPAGVANASIGGTTDSAPCRRSASTLAVRQSTN